MFDASSRSSRAQPAETRVVPVFWPLALPSPYTGDEKANRLFQALRQKLDEEERAYAEANPTLPPVQIIIVPPPLDDLRQASSAADETEAISKLLLRLADIIAGLK